MFVHIRLRWLDYVRDIWFQMTMNDRPQLLMNTMYYQYYCTDVLLMNGWLPTSAQCEDVHLMWVMHSISVKKKNGVRYSFVLTNIYPISILAAIFWIFKIHGWVIAQRKAFLKMHKNGVTFSYSKPSFKAIF